MVLSFGALGQVYEGPDIRPSTGEYDPTALLAAQSSESSGWGDFFKTLGVALLGTTANVTAKSLVGTKSPAELEKIRLQQEAAARASRNQMLVIGGVVIGVVVIGGLLLRRRSA